MNGSKRFSKMVVGAVMLASLGVLGGCSAETDDTAASVSSEDQLVLNSEQKAVIAAIKAMYEPTLNNQKTLLNFHVPYANGVINIKGDYAFVGAVVENTSGGSPDIKGTAYEKLEEMGVFDGFNLEAVAKKTNGKWVALSATIGGTDTICGADLSDMLGAKMPAGLTECKSNAPTEKQAILDAARAFLEPELNNQHVLFNFQKSEYVSSAYVVKGGFAFIAAAVQLADGKEPSIKGTSFEKAEEMGVFDGPRFEGILKKDAAGDWKVISGAYGATDTMCGADMSDFLHEKLPAGLTSCE